MEHGMHAAVPVPGSAKKWMVVVDGVIDVGGDHSFTQ
jgi:hypothetical protein